MNKKYLCINRDSRTIHIEIEDSVLSDDFIDFLHDNEFKIKKSTFEIYKHNLYYGVGVEVISISMNNDIEIIKSTLKKRAVNQYITY